MLRRSLWAAAAVAALFSNSTASAALLFDQNVTNNAIFGSGNINGSYTVERANGVELGLRAKLRFPPANTFLSQGNGTYGSFNTGNPSHATAPVWSFEWSINTDYNGTTGFDLNDLTYEIRIDSNPYLATTFYTFDPINSAHPITTYWDHSIGDNTTAQGAGTEANSVLTYQNLISSFNLAQNSWRMDFFPTPFNRNLNGQYTIELEAYHDGESVAKTRIDVIVGTGAPVPEPSTLATLGFAGILLGGVAIRRRKAAAIV